MAEVSTPELAAVVSSAGALGSIGVGATNASGAARMIDDVPRLTDAAFNVKIFVHNAPRRDDDREASTLQVCRPASKYRQQSQAATTECQSYVNGFYLNNTLQPYEMLSFATRIPSLY